MKNVAIIMAGGRGTRFWPMSTENYPKQFLKLTDSDFTMIQLTVNRIKDVIKYEDIYIVTNINYKETLESMLPEIPTVNIIYEPCGKNTAPCIGVATMLIKKNYGDANVIVLASDHIIKDENMFRDDVVYALNNCKDNVITMGIVPNYPETGYGYIEIDNISDNKLYDVKKFVEKPIKEVAIEYLKQGNYLWNSGIFIWNNKLMDSLLKKHASNLYLHLEKIYESIGNDNFIETLQCEYFKMDSISIDYAIMEKIDNIKLIKGMFGWDDVGNWLSLERLNTVNKNDSIIKGTVIDIKTEDSIIINNNKDDIIACIGINNLVIVNSNDKILIANKDQINDIKLINEKLKERKLEKYL